MQHLRWRLLWFGFLLLNSWGLRWCQTLLTSRRSNFVFSTVAIWPILVRLVALTSLLASFYALKVFVTIYILLSISQYHHKVCCCRFVKFEWILCALFRIELFIFVEKLWINICSLKCGLLLRDTSSPFLKWPVHYNL